MKTLQNNDVRHTAKTCFQCAAPHVFRAARLALAGDGGSQNPRPLPRERESGEQKVTFSTNYTKIAGIFQTLLLALSTFGKEILQNPLKLSTFVNQNTLKISLMSTFKNINL